MSTHDNKQKITDNKQMIQVIESENANDSSIDSDNSDSDSTVDEIKVQIKASCSEVFRRIESFCAYKMEEVQRSKLKENFTYRPFQDNDNDDKSCVCSRANLMWTKLKNSKDRCEVRRVYNKWKHQDIESDTEPQENKLSDYPPALEERLSASEKILGLNKPVPRDVYERLKKIEDRLLLLEGISPEYKNLWNTMNEDTKSTENTHQKTHKVVGIQSVRKRTYSTAEIDSKLHELEDRYGKRFR